MKKRIILEVIPSKSKDGDIVQLSAIKLHDLVLIDRFDYRLNEDLVLNKDLINIISYDKDVFKYLDSTKEIKDKFKQFVEDYELLYIDNEYTYGYISYLDNKKTSVFKYLDLEFSEDNINILMKKYNIEPTNYIVDILYESYIYKGNE